MVFGSIQCDENHLEHACRRLTAEEIEQVIANAAEVRPHRFYPDRVLLRERTDGGKRATVVARYDAGRHSLRPITASEEP